ncbi:MAG: hypothetical protein R2792_08420 [Saprospiraceae bacterium]|jgi:hypothetical protein
MERIDPMRFTNRSLWFAVLACMAMGFFAKSPSFIGNQRWIAGIFYVSTYLLSGIGFYWAYKGFREIRNLWSFLGLFINGFIFVSFLAFSVLIYRAFS